METRKINIIYTTDVHGNYFPFDFRRNRWGKGSLQRVHAFVAQQVKRFSGSTILIDGGDMLQGEPGHSYTVANPDTYCSIRDMAELVSKKGKLSELLLEIPSYPNIREKITCSKEAKIKVMENMEDLLKDAFDDIVDVNSLDGVRLTFADDSWVLVRPSGTEDYIRITLESRDAQRAEEIKEVCVKIINENL